MIATRTRSAGWLPGLEARDVESQQVLRFPELEILLPRLTPDGLRRQMDRVAEARDGYLANLSVQRIVSLVDRVASRWLDPTSPYVRQALDLLPLITGYPEPAIRKGLTGYLTMLRAENVRRVLEEELADPEVLDGFRARRAGGGQTRAFGPRLSLHIWSGNVPGLPAQSLLSGLLVKSAALGKVASEEPLFATLLAESIAEVDPRLADCLAVAYWPGGDDILEAVAFDRAEAVIAYGGDRVIDSIRGRVPARARLITYGHKLSFGVVARESLDVSRVAQTVDRAAYDVAKYDQQGCLSPHLLYVEADAACSPGQFAAALGEALARYGEIVPRGRLNLEEAAAAAAARHKHELRQVAGEAVSMYSGDGWAVLYDEDPRFEASCLNRTIWVKPVRDLTQIPNLIAPVRRYLQTCGVAADPDRLRALADDIGRLGIDRVCPLGRMGDVAPTWHHDGRCTLLDLLHWTDIEPESDAGRWEFGHPALGLFGKD